MISQTTLLNQTETKKPTLTEIVKFIPITKSVIPVTPGMYFQAVE